MNKVEGLDNVMQNLSRKQKIIVDHLTANVTKGAIIAESNIKTNWTERNTHGKGFQSRFGQLRQSISHKVYPSPNLIRGYVYATKNYAPYVEFRWNRRYAYMLPGFLEVRDRIWSIIKSTDIK